MLIILSCSFSPQIVRISLCSSRKYQLRASLYFWGEAAAQHVNIFAPFSSPPLAEISAHFLVDFLSCVLC